MFRNITNWIINISDELPILAILLFVIMSLLFLYWLFILFRNIFNIIAMPTTSINRLVAGKVVEVKGILQGRKEVFESPLKNEKLAFLGVEIGFYYEDNTTSEKSRKENKLGYYQKGDELFNIKDNSGEVLIAHHTFLNKAFKTKVIECKNDKFPKELFKLFPEIKKHLVEHKQKFYVKYSYLKENEEIMVTGRVVRASINKEDRLAIYGGVGSLKQWQKKLMNSNNKRDFHDDRQDEIQLYTNLEMKSADANQFNINFGSEKAILIKKLFQVILAFIFIVPLSILSFMVAYYKFLV